MRNIYLAILFIILLVITPLAYAEEFAITKIGALDVGGKYFSQWWYEPTRLTMEGTGSQGANIDVYIDDQVTTIKAGVTDGKWKYTHPVDLEKTDHKVKVASGDKSYAFTLTIGASAVPPEALSQNISELPQTGLILPIMLFATVSGAAIFYGIKQKS